MTSRYDHPPMCALCGQDWPLIGLEVIMPIGPVCPRDACEVEAALVLDDLNRSWKDWPAGSPASPGFKNTGQTGRIWSKGGGTIRFHMPTGPARIMPLAPVNKHYLPRVVSKTAAFGVAYGQPTNLQQAHQKVVQAAKQMGRAMGTMARKVQGAIKGIMGSRLDVVILDDPCQDRGEDVHVHSVSLLHDQLRRRVLVSVARDSFELLPVTFARVGPRPRIEVPPLSSIEQLRNWVRDLDEHGTSALSQLTEEAAEPAPGSSTPRRGYKCPRPSRSLRLDAIGEHDPIAPGRGGVSGGYASRTRSRRGRFRG